MGRKAKLFYFKLYLVSKDNFDKCNVTGGRRLLNCDVPEKEKKYTFYFQEISPSPWGLEFTPEKSYYVICKPNIKYYSVTYLLLVSKILIISMLFSLANVYPIIARAAKTLGIFTA